MLSACGKKGAPLPPLVKLPAAPADLAAERRGDAVDVQFTVPSANTDNTRPANIERVDVYAITAPPTITDDQILKHGTKVGSVPVKAPRDPDQAVEPGDPDATAEPPEGEGLNQGALAHVVEKLDGDVMAPYDPSIDGESRHRNATASDEPQPLLGPPTATMSRTYTAVGISTRGKKGPFSKRAAVPLVAPPPAPAKPVVSYDEKAIKVTWKPVIMTGMVQEPAGDDVLPSTPIGAPQPKLTYNVYDVAPEAIASDAPSGNDVPARAPALHARGEPEGTAVKLTKEPIAETTFEDSRIAWGERRCYTVRAIAVVNDLPVESEAAVPACTTLKDTFPPSPPKNVQTVPASGVINLIWDANTEPDLAGYLVLRGFEPDALRTITPAPVPDARFTDSVQPGTRYFYAVKAVDTAGNIGAESETVAETAR